VFSFELYADLPIALTIVHCDGTSILSLYSTQDDFQKDLSTNLPRSVLIDKLSKDCTDFPNIGVAYIYLDLNYQSQQTTEYITGVIVKQLLMRLPSIPERVEEI
jgi:hypothetical protein